MPSKENLEAAGVDGEIPEVDEEKPRRRGKAAKEGKTPKQQADALQAPPELRFETARGTFIVPTQFTLGDLVQKRIMDDVSAFVMLVIVEINKISGLSIGDDRVAALFHDSIKPYFAVALRTSNVIEFLKVRILLKIARLVNAKGEALPYSLVDLSLLENLDLVGIGAHIIGRWAEQQAKNR